MSLKYYLLYVVTGHSQSVLHSLHDAGFDPDIMCTQGTWNTDHNGEEYIYLTDNDAIVQSILYCMNNNWINVIEVIAVKSFHL